MKTQLKIQSSYYPPKADFNEISQHIYKQLKNQYKPKKLKL